MELVYPPQYTNLSTWKGLCCIHRGLATAACITGCKNSLQSRICSILGVVCVLCFHIWGAGEWVMRNEWFWDAVVRYSDCGSWVWYWMNGTSEKPTTIVFEYWFSAAYTDGWVWWCVMVWVGRKYLSAVVCLLRVFWLVAAENAFLHLPSFLSMR